MDNTTKSNDEARKPQIKESGRLGPMVIVAVLLGLPLLGILAKLLGY